MLKSLIGRCCGNQPANFPQETQPDTQVNIPNPALPTSTSAEARRHRPSQSLDAAQRTSRPAGPKQMRTNQDLSPRFSSPPGNTSRRFPRELRSASLPEATSVAPPSAVSEAQALSPQQVLLVE